MASRPYASLLQVSPQRLASLQSLRNDIFGDLIAKRTPIMSEAKAILDYYPPDVDIPALATQDRTLNSLNLVDVRREELIEREKFAESRGKTIRVSGNKQIIRIPMSQVLVQ